MVKKLIGLVAVIVIILGSLCMCAVDTPTTVTDAGQEVEMTVEQENAVKKAESYLNIMHFSRAALIEQLMFEGFTADNAAFAADNCGADWNEQAAGKAQDYLDVMSFSRHGLIDQLKFDGFTAEQAEYGVNAVGY